MVANFSTLRDAGPNSMNLLAAVGIVATGARFPDTDCRRTRQSSGVLVQGAHVHFETEELTAQLRSRHSPVDVHQIEGVTVLGVCRLLKPPVSFPCACFLALNWHSQSPKGDIVRESNTDSRSAERPAERAGYAEWIAIGAVAAGSIGAIVGMANCSRPRRSTTASEALDPETVTAPHGDKLRGAVI